MIPSKYSKIKALLVEKNMSQEELAEKVKIEKTTLNRKLNEKSDFSISEVDRLCSVLEIPDDKIRYYFFQ
jgi:transcriptional regulator with XRE-family HTH domain